MRLICNSMYWVISDSLPSLLFMNLFHVRPFAMRSLLPDRFFFLSLILYFFGSQSDFRAQAAGNTPISSYDFVNLVLTSADTPGNDIPDSSNSPQVQLSNEDHCSAETSPNSHRMRSRSDAYCPYKPQAPIHQFMGPELTGPELQSNPAGSFWRKIPILRNFFGPPPKKSDKRFPIIDFDIACLDPARQVRVCSIWAPFMISAPQLMPTLPFCRYSTFKVHENKLFWHVVTTNLMSVHS